jgi:hypothetical protein
MQYANTPRLSIILHLAKIYHKSQLSEQNTKTEYNLKTFNANPFKGYTKCCCIYFQMRVIKPNEKKYKNKSKNQTSRSKNMMLHFET